MFWCAVVCAHFANRDPGRRGASACRSGAALRRPRSAPPVPLPAALGAAALLVTATLDVAAVVLMLSLFSFLGLGTPAPAPELGAMTANARSKASPSHWWLPIIRPRQSIFVLCFGANLAGDGLTRALRGV